MPATVEPPRTVPSVPTPATTTTLPPMNHLVPPGQTLVVDPNNPQAVAAQAVALPSMALPPGHPQVAVAYAPPPPVAQPSRPPFHLAGTLTISPELMKNVKVGSFVYVSVRTDVPAGQTGKLLAARRATIQSPDMFPLAYEVSSADLMAGADVNAPLRVEARIDQDGDAISRTPGDLYGRTPKTVKNGDDPVNLAITEKQ